MSHLESGTKFSVVQVKCLILEKDHLVFHGKIVYLASALRSEY